jgi:hypothetical protein
MISMCSKLFITPEYKKGDNLQDEVVSVLNSQK